MQAGLVNHFSFIPMLTKNDSNGHGAKYNRDNAKVGTKNKELVAFLDECVQEGRRDIVELEKILDRCEIKMTVYSGKSHYFPHRQRQDYFARIGNELLINSLVFVDPDIGLEVANSDERHLLFDEVKELYRRMHESSILMLFQHFPRVARQEYLNRRSEELKDKISGDYPVCIDNNEIIFFFLTKNESLEHSLTHLIAEYAESYSC